MTLSLQRFATGDTNYVGKHNSNADAIEGAVAILEAVLSGITGSGAISITTAFEALFGNSVAVIGAGSYAASGSGTNLTVQAGYCYRPLLQQILHKASSTVLSFSGLAAATYYIQVDATGTPNRSDDSTEALYSVVWTGSAFGTITRLAAVAWGQSDWLSAQVSAALGASYTTLDARLEAGETKAKQGADFAALAGLANGVATLGADAKLTAAQLPDLAISEYLGTVADQTAMLALSGQKGDWCIRTDNAKVYIITGSDPSVLGDWTALSYPVDTTGTVESVGLSMPTEFSVAGSPVTSSGTLAVSKADQNANLVYAGPSSGGAAAPTFRALVQGDLPTQPYDVGGSFSGAPTASQVIARYPFPRSVTFPAGLTNSQGVAATAATAQTDFDLKKNGSSVGTMRFAASGTVASFIMASQTTFAAGDVLTVVAPGTPDATLANIGFALAGTR
jgi:hypothetical protein